MTTDKPTQDPERPAGGADSIESLRSALETVCLEEWGDAPIEERMISSALSELERLRARGHVVSKDAFDTLLAECESLRAGAVEVAQLREEKDALLKGEHLLFSQRHLPEVIAERDALRAELETERLRLAACGAAALGNTEKALAKRITPGNPYYSATYSDVCRAVDREMALRAELAAERAKREEAERDCGDLRAILKDEQGTVMHLRNLLEDREAERDEARTRADAAEARCEALEDGLKAIVAHVQKVGDGGGHWWYLNYAQTLLLTPYTFSLSAHDAKVREPLEKQAGELKARVEELLDLAGRLTHEPGCHFVYTGEFPSKFKCICGISEILKRESTVSLSAHDARIRREALEAAWERVQQSTTPWFLERWPHFKEAILSPAPDAASVQPSASPLPERNTQRPQAGLEEDGDE